MNENYKLEKEYVIPFDVFREAYHEFQKKNVYPKSYLFMGIFIIIAVIYIFSAFKDPSNTLSYVLIFICLALASREWYNPRKIRRSMVDTFREMGEVRYRFTLDDEYAEFSTLYDENVENSEEPGEEDTVPEKTRIKLGEDVSVQEYDRFFLMYSGKAIFYIIPKDSFGEDELEIVRNIGK